MLVMVWVVCARGCCGGVEGDGCGGPPASLQTAVKEWRQEGSMAVCAPAALSLSPCPKPGRDAVIDKPWPWRATRSACSCFGDRNAYTPVQP